jgi:hypothetical protein
VDASIRRGLLASAARQLCDGRGLQVVGTDAGGLEALEILGTPANGSFLAGSLPFGRRCRCDGG